MDISIVADNTRMGSPGQSWPKQEKGCLQASLLAPNQHKFLSEDPILYKVSKMVEVLEVLGFKSGPSLIVVDQDYHTLTSR